MLLSALGGIIGAVIWAAVAAALNMEMNVIAIGVGALCGLGMRIGAAEEADFMTGVLAGVVTIAAVLLGKHMAVEYVVAEATRVDPRNVWAIADEVVYEWRLDGQTITWPPGVIPEEAYTEADYPADVWEEAEYRYDVLTEEEKADLAAYPMYATPDWQIAYLADEVLREWEMDGERIDWGGVIISDYPMHEEEYPEEIWTAATTRWLRMSSNEQRALERRICAEWDEENAAFRAELEAVKDEMFSDSVERSLVGGRRSLLLLVVSFLTAGAIGGYWGD
jgi:hypothetical protein